MPITCQVCQRTFTNIITSTHLKSHNLSSAQYRQTYGGDSLASEEYRIAQRKGSTGENNGMYGKAHTIASKDAMSSTRRANKATKPKKEPKTKPAKVPKVHDTAKKTAKMLATKAANGSPLYPSFAGKTHSDETKAKIAAAAASCNAKKIVQSRITRTQFIESLAQHGIILKNEVDSDVLEFHCTNCQNSFTRADQFLTLSKFHVEPCRVCHPKKKGITQAKLFKELQSLVPDVCLESNVRGLIGSKELDILSRDHQIGIEYCGLLWHSDYFDTEPNPRRHLEKLDECAKHGIKLFTVFEDEYLGKPELVLSKLAKSLGKQSKRIFARKCELRTIDSKAASIFLNQNHLQGNGKSNVRYGLFFEDELVSVMTFSKGNLSRKLKGWEINRFCTKMDHVVVGGASKMFKAFLKDHNPEMVVSYADRRWGEGKVYGELGFVLEHNSVPNYWYVVGDKRIHRFALRKNEKDDKSLTEVENRKLQGYSRIWDCGHAKWLWTAPSHNSGDSLDL